ncbi:hypothetical protein C8F04DRAFT_1199018 [Mycena alexandri]|uniref:Uncharacterized protein n=1 Tax=Mycena alexandri TaxID=1745969 RepID=A0AAD6WRN1_9AGAR|nr:hypothetical protein C8F04DRAFT_1199018 [Mycena alexandri]
MAKATKSRTPRKPKTRCGKRRRPQPPVVAYSWTERRADAAALIAARGAWARRQEEVASAQARFVSDLATAFGVSETEILLDREAWLSAPDWQPSRYGWEHVKYPVDTTGTGWGPAPARSRETKSGSGWGPPATSSTAWGTGNGWRMWGGASTAGGTESTDGTAS